MDSQNQREIGRPITCGMFDGELINLPRNPGLHARNRYGHEIYKHAEHWMTLKRPNSWIPYRPSNHFPQCALPGHQACLNQYSGDGNLQFDELIP